LCSIYVDWIVAWKLFFLVDSSSLFESLKFLNIKFF
jgi:hypothetical protein